MLEFPSTLGLKLTEAKRRLAEAGFSVVCVPVASKKGGGAVPRVIRERLVNPGCAELCYALFDEFSEGGEHAAHAEIG